MEKDKKYNLVNLNDPRQDIHKIRKHDTNLKRYQIAERLLPINEVEILSVLELGGGIGEFSNRMRNKGI